MSATEKIAAQIRERLQETMEPLRQELEGIETRIAELEDELGELRKLRTETRRMLAVIDPEVATQGRHKASQGKKANGYALKAAPETVDQIYAWLEQSIDGQHDFNAPAIVRGDYGNFDLCSGATLNAALYQLNEDGRIRLDSLSGNRRKNYKLVAQ